MAPETGATDIARVRKTLSAKLAAKAEPATASAHPEATTTADAPTATTLPATPAPQWSNEDETLFNTLAARRKATRGGRRGRDVGSQLIQPGDIAPNPGTVVSVIVGLVAELGTVSRAALVNAMGQAAFANAKAKPQDAGWCQGYIAGALRDGFLAVADTIPAVEQ